MALADFRHITRFRVPYCDIDMLRHVNNVSYVTWAETARCEYFEEVLAESLTERHSMILVRQEFDYEQQIEYRDQVAVGCRISRLGGKSFDFTYEIWDETRNRRAARASSTMVAFDYEQNKSIVIPEKWREVITKYEVVKPKTE